MRGCIKKGFDNVEFLKKHDELAPLRSRKDFRKLLRELEAKAKSGAA